LVESSNIRKILRLKIKLILLGVAAESAEELEDLRKVQKAKELEELSKVQNREPSLKLSKQQLSHWIVLEQNLIYFIDIIELNVLKLRSFEDFEKPLQFEKVMQAYRQTAAELRLLESRGLN